MKRTIRLLVCSVVVATLVFAFASPAFAPVFVCPYDVCGYIRDSDSGEGISGATVELYHYQVGNPVVDATKVSSPSGYYYFDGLSASYEYYLRADHPRYRQNTVPTDWYGSNTKKDVTLRPLVQRVADDNRYSTAAAITRRAWDLNGSKNWSDSDDIIIASGEDRAAADPLAAAGLCWLYEGPLLLVNSRYVPSEAKQIVNEIRAARYPNAVTIHVVGGTTSIPQARLNELAGDTVQGPLTFDRIASSGSRYDLAAAIALRMKSKAFSESKQFPAETLVANGADPDKFFDALALSTISAWRGSPILLVSVDSLPPATKSAIQSLNPSRVIVGGGPNTVSGDVLGKIDALVPTVERWWGANRYATAIDIADEAAAESPTPWLGYITIGTAAKIPDALTGGAYLGKYSGMLVLTKGTVVPGDTAAWLEAHDAQNQACYAFGGPNSIAESTRQKMIDILMH